MRNRKKAEWSWQGLSDFRKEGMMEGNKEGKEEMRNEGRKSTVL